MEDPIPGDSEEQEAQAAKKISRLIKFEAERDNNNHQEIIKELYQDMKDTILQIEHKDTRKEYLHFGKQRMVKLLEYKFIHVPYEVDSSLLWYQEPNAEMDSKLIATQKPIVKHSH